MRNLLLLIAAAAAAAFASAPAEAVPSSRARTPQAQSQSDPETVRGAAELEGYATWLAELNRRQAPANHAIQSLHGAWQEAFASRDMPRAAAEFRGALARTIEALDAAHADLATIETPDFPRLALGDDLRPAALLTLFRRSNREIRTGIESFHPVLDAVQRNDSAAAQRAVGHLMSAMRLVVRSQATIMRATLAGTPREESSWEIVNLDLLVFNAAERLLAAWPAIESRRPDPGFAPDLLALADRIDANAREGSIKLEAELVSLSAELGEAEAARDTAAVSILRRMIAGLTVSRQVFAPARALAAAFREQAPRLRGPIDFEAVGRISSALRVTRTEFERIGGEEVEAAAAAD
jgi:hypothetical protein